MTLSVHFQELNQRKKTDHEIIDIVAISESLGFLMIYHITPIISFSDLGVSF